MNNNIITLLSRQNSFSDFHNQYDFQDGIDLADQYILNTYSNQLILSRRSSIDDQIETEQEHNFEVTQSREIANPQREIEITLSDVSTANTGYSYSSLGNSEVSVHVIETQSYQNSLDIATSEDFLHSTEIKRYVRDIEQELFRMRNMKGIRLECNYKQFFRWMRNLVQKDQQFRNALENDAILKQYIQQIQDLFPRTRKSIYKNSQESRRNQKYEPKNITTRRGEKPNKVKSIEKLNKERLEQLNMIDILCNRITREQIVKYFSYDILAYLFEFMLPYINNEQKFYTKETDLARMVLEKIKFERCGSQQDIINREYQRQQYN